MKESDKYIRIVEWSDEDQCFIGSCPELFYGGCHGNDPRAVFDELCAIIEDVVEMHIKEGTPLPKPLTGKDLIPKPKKAA